MVTGSGVKMAMRAPLPAMYVVMPSSAAKTPKPMLPVSSSPRCSSAFVMAANSHWRRWQLAIGSPMRPSMRRTTGLLKSPVCASMDEALKSRSPTCCAGRRTAGSRVADCVAFGDCRARRRSRRCRCSGVSWSSGVGVPLPRRAMMRMLVWTWPTSESAMCSRCRVNGAESKSRASRTPTVKSMGPPTSSCPSSARSSASSSNIALEKKHRCGLSAAACSWLIKSSVVCSAMPPGLRADMALRKNSSPSSHVPTCSSDDDDHVKSKVPRSSSAGMWFMSTGMNDARFA
mmetsp:Transcript_4350/g.13925  ORF Transcript_4350/g.13925 Transcript_4350/m.13925 type:complete len:288 (-) Transcript_4350:289-1152(-)